MCERSLVKARVALFECEFSKYDDDDDYQTDVPCTSNKLKGFTLFDVIKFIL